MFFIISYHMDSRTVTSMGSGVIPLCCSVGNRLWTRHCDKSGERTKHGKVLTSRPRGQRCQQLAAKSQHTWLVSEKSVGEAEPQGQTYWKCEYSPYQAGGYNTELHLEVSFIKMWQASRGTLLGSGETRTKPESTVRSQQCSDFLLCISARLCIWALSFTWG